ncbi:protein POLR1D-like isoform X2 [Channa argus]|uniref:protein POLR1D-like isoform X2 n=1 Tax=Channa argus TaxID=215402 RepID=UPI003521B8F3
MKLFFPFRRAIEELLRETDRARVRAETMGPTGWLKCPLQTTNKRFLLNTLRSTGLQRRSGEPRAAESSPTRGRLRSESPDRSRDRSRTSSRGRRSPGDPMHHKHHHRESRNNKYKRHDGDKERNYSHSNKRQRTREEDKQDREKNRQTS